MQATNQYTQQSNFKRKLTASMAEWLTHMSEFQIQVQPNLIYYVWD